MPDSYQEMAEIVERYAARSGDQSGATAIGGLYLGRAEGPSQPTYQSQWPCLALVVRGEKSVSAGAGELFYGVGDYLVVSLDMPVVSRVTVASPDQPHLGLGITIESEQLNRVLLRTGFRPSAPHQARPVQPLGQ